ncbi:MAG: lysylphosphatidylglycerol synthase domain-containing protein, partial [Acidobacteriota bacterium]
GGANGLPFQSAAAALGSSLRLPAAAAAFALGSLAGTLSGTPGGAGTTELAAMAPLVALGVPTDGALAAVLLARGVHYASCLLIGGAALLAARRP